MGDAQLGAEVADHVDLVLHQGDEGRYDDGRAFRHQRGQLVAQRLAATRGHQYESVVAAKDAFDDFFLVSLELVETENILQQSELKNCVWLSVVSGLCSVDKVIVFRPHGARKK